MKSRRIYALAIVVCCIFGAAFFLRDNANRLSVTFEILPASNSEFHRLLANLPPELDGVVFERVSGTELWQIVTVQEDSPTARVSLQKSTDFIVRWAQDQWRINHTHEPTIPYDANIILHDINPPDALASE